jgi:hypothetical protein
VTGLLAAVGIRVQHVVSLIKVIKILFAREQGADKCVWILEERPYVGVRL